MTGLKLHISQPFNEVNKGKTPSLKGSFMIYSRAAIQSSYVYNMYGWVCRQTLTQTLHIPPPTPHCCVEGGLGMPTVLVFSSALLCSLISFASRSHPLQSLNQITISVVG